MWWVEFDPTIGNDSANRNLKRVVVPFSSARERVCPGEMVVTVAGQSKTAMADHYGRRKIALTRQLGVSSK